VSDRVDTTVCSTFELLATGYHEAGHAVGALIVHPALPIESATIVPDDDWRGRVGIGDWTDLIVPDEEDGDDGVCEHGRQHLEAEAVMTSLGGLVEGWLRTGNIRARVHVGRTADRADIIDSGEVLCDDDVGAGRFAERGTGRAWMESMRSRAVAHAERHPYFWHAVGLVAAALMREKTLSGMDEKALVRTAEARHRPTP